MLSRLSLFVVFVAVVVVAAVDVRSARAAPESPPEFPGTALVETLGGIANSDGWCVATSTTNLDLVNLRPARVTTTILQRARFVSLRFVAGATSTRMCHRVSSSAVTLVALACDALDVDAAGVLTDGQSATYAIARDFKPATSGAFPLISAQSNAGTDGAVCVSIGW